jgi:hypothetical protein
MIGNRTLLSPRFETVGAQTPCDADSSLQRFEVCCPASPSNKEYPTSSDSATKYKNLIKS